MTAFIQDIHISVTSPDRGTLEELRANAYGDLGNLIKSGVFSFKNGEATLSRDKDGKLRSVSIKEYTFRE